MTPPLTIPFDAPIDVQAALARAANVMLPEDYYRLPVEKRAQAVTVSRLAALDQIQQVADALARKQAEGWTWREFQDWADGQPWTLPRHQLETIYRNSVQTAYMAGHWRAFEATKDDFPYLMYDAINDSRTRPSHRALDGVIKPVDDPFWKTHFPPIGHRCRCSVRSLMEHEARARGGVTQHVPAEGRPDPGWGGDPRRWNDALAEVARARRENCPGESQLARGRKPRGGPHCIDATVANHLALTELWARHNGQLPPPQERSLPELSPAEPEALYARFLDALGEQAAFWLELPDGSRVFVDDRLFRRLDGTWKIGKRGRDRWLLYLSELLRSPQEIWRLQRAMSEELYLLGRFQRGKRRIDAIAVFKREVGEEDWGEGKTAYTFDSETGLAKKRVELLSDGGMIRWIKM